MGDLRKPEGGQSKLGFRRAGEFDLVEPPFASHQSWLKDGQSPRDRNPTRRGTIFNLNMERPLEAGIEKNDRSFNAPEVRGINDDGARVDPGNSSWAGVRFGILEFQLDEIAIFRLRRGRLGESE